MANLETAQNILLIAPHRLGDSLFATPGVKALRQTKPNARIDVVALSNLSFEIFKHNTCVNNVYPLQNEIKNFAKTYDVILPLQNIKKIQEYLTGVENVLWLPRYDGSYHYSENFYRFVIQNLNISNAIQLAPYELNFTQEDIKHASDLLKPINDKYILAVHMGCHRIAKEGQHFIYKIFPFLATKDSRSWPFKKFNYVIQKLLKQYPHLAIVFTGSESERYAGEYLTPNPRILNLMGKSNVTQLAALLKQCNLLLTGDTGPMHVGSCVGIPMVLLFGETNPAQTGPHPTLSHHKIIEKKGMNNISVNEVYNAITGFLN